MIEFQKISKYADDNSIILPNRATQFSAGYDFYAAEDIILEPYKHLMDIYLATHVDIDVVENYDGFYGEYKKANLPFTLKTAADVIKAADCKVALVPTGVKCHLPHDCYLQLAVRSSLAIKNWIILANGVGIVDSDYYNNPDNEGHIYFPLINLLPYPVKIQKGDRFGQGIILKYNVADNEQKVTTARTGGSGSTDGQA